MGKGKSETKTTLPKYYTDFQENEILPRALEVADRGYLPFMGIDVAAMSPGQMTARTGVNQVASAFGLPTASGGYLPQSQNIGGVQGYSSFPAFYDAVQQQQAQFPGGIGLDGPGSTGNNQQSELEALLARINELEANQSKPVDPLAGFYASDLGMTGGGR